MSQFIEMSKAWPVMKLNGHVDIIRGVSYKPSDVVSSLDANSVGILRANNIANGEINTNEMVYVDQARVSDAQRIRIGDIVVCASSGSQSLVGKAAINKNLTREYAHGAFCLLIRCNNTILPKYLNIYLQTALYRNQIESLSCGSNILNIKADHLTSLDIPIPDIKQQSDFVTIIEQADKSKFVGFKSQFIEMFGDNNTVSLCDVAHITMGSSPDSEYYNENGEGLPFYQGKTEFGDMYIKPAVIFCTEPVREADVNDILMSVRAPVGAVNIAQEHCCIGRGLAAIRTKSEKMTPLFLYYALKIKEDNIAALGTGSTFKAINKDVVYSIQIPASTMDEQQKFVAIAQQADKSKYFS